MTNIDSHNDKINIIQFMPYFPPHKWWVEFVWKEIGEYWTKNNFWKFINIVSNFDQDVFLVSSNLEKITFLDTVIWYKKDNYEVLVIPSLEIINNFPVYKIWSKRYMLIKNYLNSKLNSSNSFRVITHTRFFLTSLLWGFFSKKRNIRWVHIEHWSDYVRLSSKLMSFIAFVYDSIFWKWLLKKSDTVLAISESCKKFVLKKFVSREVGIFYRGINLDIKCIEKKWGIKLVYVWRLVSLKWVWDLIDAYKLSWVENELIIVWDWEERKNLESKIDWYNIKFLWYKSRDFILNFLKNNNCILVNPSYSEWMPTTVIEWLITKNIVIASDVWWTSEVSDKQDLVLFEAWKIRNLSEKIVFSISHFDKFRWLSSSFVRKKFNWNANIKKLYNLIK